MNKLVSDVNLRFSGASNITGKGRCNSSIFIEISVRLIQR